jgi:hypothetical protein
MKSSSLQLSSQSFSRHDARPAPLLGNFPQTGHNYHATTEAPVAVSSADRSESSVHAAQMRSFRLLSKQALAPQSRWQFALETTIFSLIAGLVAWPLVSLLIVLAQTARG